MEMFIMDTEGDGLLDTISKFHCAVFKINNKDTWYIFADGFDEVPDHFKAEVRSLGTVYVNPLSKLSSFLRGRLKDNGIVCHNVLGFDLRAFKKLGYIDTYTVGKDTLDGNPVRIFDSLVMSRSLNPDRQLPTGCPAKKWNPVDNKWQTVGAHGLDAWGYRVANAKPAVDDWRNQPLETYINRCIEDVKINELAFHALVKEAKDKAKDTKNSKGDWEKPLRLAMKDYFLMVQQEETGCPFDIEGAYALIDRIDEMMKEIEEEVEPQLPLRDIPKSQRPSFPASPFTKDGSISATGLNWLERLGYDINRTSLDVKAPPKVPFKKDGGLSTNGAKYCLEAGIDIEDREAVVVYLRKMQALASTPYLEDSLLKQAKEDLNNKVEPEMKEPMRLANQADIKEYLVFQGGWKPLHWGTKDITRDNNKKAYEEEEVKLRARLYIEEVKENIYKDFIYKEFGFNFDRKSFEDSLKFVIKKARYLITSPKLKDDRGNLCENLEQVDGEMAKQIVKWLSLRNRRSVIKAMDESKETGWLNNPRLEIDGKLSGAHTGLTNTHRKRHTVIANLPKADEKVLLGREMRSLFYAPEGYSMLGYDAQALENRVAGMYAWQYDNGEYAKMVLDGDCHETYAEAYSKAAERVVSRSEGKGITYACLPKENTEVLTVNGWKHYDELAKGDSIVSLNEQGGYEVDEIKGLVEFKDKDVYFRGNKHIGFESTPDHRWLVETRKQRGKERYYVREYKVTDELHSEHNIVNNGFWDTESSITKEQAYFMGWLLSDGYYIWSERDEKTSSSFGKKKGVQGQIIQSKNKYWRDVEKTLTENRLPFTKDVEERENGNSIYRYRIKADSLRTFLDEVVKDRSQKHEVDWCAWVLKLNKEGLQSFFDAFWLGDGHGGKRGRTMITQNEGNICDAIRLCGNLLGKVVTYTYKTDKCVVLSFRDSRRITGQRLTKEYRGKKDVFCLTTNNSNFVIRQNGYITVTGNCLYGAQAAKVGKMLGVTNEVAQRVIDAFWDTNWSLKKLKENLESYWEGTGKKYIIGLDGRKIYTRSKHALLNCLFQSAGAIIMDTAGVFMYEALKKRGLIQDKRAQRVIYYHK